MQGRNVAVTGGANGLGEAIVRALAAAGAGVAIIDRDAAGAQALADRLGGVAIAGDIVRREAAHALFGRAVAALGRIDGLVNAAGVYPRRPLLEITDEDWEFDVAVNVRGLYHMSVAAVRHMREQGGGRIVNIASIDAFKAHPQNAHYAATKAAVVSLTRSFGLECAPAGILVNGVAPAAIATERAKASDWLAEHAAHTPLGRAAEPADIADLVLFLLSERNRYMVGETVIVSGGMLFA
ncbi:MAG: SDR family oxidoreductase [Acidisphaera sp.]|nr:SDR family oxidoreductase [Acidisphaera sp.]